MQWMDREGKTPLIVACMNPELCNVAKTLIELGANVNAYRPGIGYFLACYGFWLCILAYGEVILILNCQFSIG